jgi:UDP-N-acetylglucosamine:LPS N-acetylglucosamine transferase
VQLILLCGRNEAVRREIEALPRRIPRFVEGFTRDVPRYMALADFFIGKPGPGCISEALAMGLPVIVERNAWTLAHERYNADWIEEQGVGMVVRNFSQIAGAVRELLEPERYRQYRARVSAIRNTAVYEIPDVLDKDPGPARLSSATFVNGISQGKSCFRPVAFQPVAISSVSIETEDCGL